MTVVHGNVDFSVSRDSLASDLSIFEVRTDEGRRKFSTIKISVRDDELDEMFGSDSLTRSEKSGSYISTTSSSYSYSKQTTVSSNNSTEELSKQNLNDIADGEIFKSGEVSKNYQLSNDYEVSNDYELSNEYEVKDVENLDDNKIYNDTKISKDDQLSKEDEMYNEYQPSNNSKLCKADEFSEDDQSSLIQSSANSFNFTPQAFDDNSSLSEISQSVEMAQPEKTKPQLSIRIEPSKITRSKFSLSNIGSALDFSPTSKASSPTTAQSQPNSPSVCSFFTCRKSRTANSSSSPSPSSSAFIKHSPSCPFKKLNNSIRHKKSGIDETVLVTNSKLSKYKNCSK